LGRSEPTEGEPGDQSDADQDVEAVQAGHEEVDAEEGIDAVLVEGCELVEGDGVVPGVRLRKQRWKDIDEADDILDDRTARSYERDGGYDVFSPLSARDKHELGGEFGAGFSPTPDVEVDEDDSYSPILDDGDEFEEVDDEADDEVDDLEED